MNSKPYNGNLYFVICLFVAIIFHFSLLYFTKYEISYKKSRGQDKAIRIIDITPKMTTLSPQVETQPKPEKVVVPKKVLPEPIIIEEHPKDVIITEKGGPEEVFVFEGSSKEGADEASFEGKRPSTNYLPFYSVSKLPEIIELFKPEYPELARARGLEGVVILEVDIDTKGFVKEVRVVKSLGFGFDEAAVKAIKRCRFSPAEQFGKLVPVRMRIPIRFELED
ncbi:MAG: energy transducer TonB [bacterium]|nr:energy transducer TonB [bacterium]